MADRKITDLTALAAGSQATGDLVTIVDVSEAAAADKNKKMTMENLFKGIPGDVGIGVSAPARPLSILSGQISARFESSSADSQIEIKDSTGTVVYGSSSGNAIVQAGSAERMRIDSSGRVGIGTSSPATTLELKSDADAQTTATIPTLRITNDDGSAVANDITGSVEFFSEDTSDPNHVSGFMRANSETSAGVNYALTFGTKNNSIGDAVERLRIDSSGNVGIGTSSPGTFTEVGASNLVVGSGSGGEGITIYSGTSSTGILAFADGTSGSAQYQGMVNYSHSANAMRFSTAGSEAMRIDSSGRVLVGASSTVSVAGSSSFIQHHGNKTTSNLALVGYANNLGGPILSFGSSRSTTVGTPGTIVSSGDFLGDIRFAGDDGTDINTTAASIRGEVDGTPGSNDMPGRLVFNTTADGASSPTERMRIDSVGNVAIGTTSIDRQFHVQGGGVAGTQVQIEGTVDSAGIKFVPASGDQYEIQATDNSALIFYNRTDTTERMRIDSSGRLLVGTSSSRATHGSGEARLQIEGTNTATGGVSVTRTDNSAGGATFSFGKTRNGSVVQSGDDLGTIHWQADDGTDLATPACSISGVVDGTPGSNDMPGRLVFKTTADGGGSPTERMRIKSNGFVDIANNGTVTSGNAHVIHSSIDNDTLFVRNANSSFSNNILRVACPRNTSNGTYNFFNCVREGTANVLYIKDSGDVINTNNSYGQISDIKLKENIVDASSQWDDIKAIQIRNYNFKESTGQATHTQLGVIAQEVETVSPGLVSETPDRDDNGIPLDTVTKTVNTSVLYMKAVKALQEAMDRIETLETKVAALEAQ